jgi:hypothetical protein
MGHGGKREGSGPKTVPKPKGAAAEVAAVHERGLQQLDELFDLMVEVAKGVFIVVSPKARQKPTDADFVAEVATVETVCKACKRPRLKAPEEVWEVYKVRPDRAMLQHLHEQLAGKAAAKQGAERDTEINVFFGDIDCEAEDGTDERAHPNPPEGKPRIGL